MTLHNVLDSAHLKQGQHDLTSVQLIHKKRPLASSHLKFKRYINDSYPRDCDGNEDGNYGHHNPREMDIVVGDDPGGAHEDAVVEADQGDDWNDTSSQEWMDNLWKKNLNLQFKDILFLYLGKDAKLDVSRCVRAK